MSKRQDQVDVKPEAMNACDGSGEKTLSQHDYVLDDGDKASPQGLSLTEEGLALTAPSLLAHSRLTTVPGAQRIEGRTISFGNSTMSGEQENQPEAVPTARDDGDKASPLVRSLTEELAMTAPSLLTHSRLTTVPGAQRIEGRNASLRNSIMSEQHDDLDEAVTPPHVMGHVVEGEIDTAPVSVTPIYAQVEMMQDPEPLWKVLMANRKCQLGFVLMLFLIIGLIVFVVVEFTDGTSPVPATTRTPEVPTQTPSISWSPTTSPTSPYTFRPFLTTVLPRSSLDELDRQDSPQQKALAWVNSNALDWTDSRRLQRWTLHVIYDSTGGAFWNSRQRWMTETAECSWENVTCDGQNVVGLSLHDNALKGRRIPEELGLLTLLKDLDLALNGLTGSLPSALSGLTNLVHLKLCCNRLTGMFSSVLMNLKNLTIFDVRNNLFSGSLPRPIGEMTNLESLLVGYNSLTGTFPDTFIHLIHLTTFDAELNMFSGSLPRAIGEMTKLEILSLSYNLLTGTLPESLGDMTSLAALQLDGNRFTGTIPNRLMQLNNLSKFWAIGNNLTNLPDDLGLWSSIQSLNLEGNSITGNISSQIGMLTKLSVLDLSGNDMTGTLPSQIGMLTNLTSLILDQNALTGTLPSELGLLTMLEWLTMGENFVSGLIPSQLGQLTDLMVLTLSSNDLTGSIPSELGLLTSLESIMLAFTNVTGAVPETLCKIGIPISVECDSVENCTCCFSAFYFACPPS